MGTETSLCRRGSGSRAENAAEVKEPRPRIPRGFPRRTCSRRELDRFSRENAIVGAIPRDCGGNLLHRVFRCFVLARDVARIADAAAIIRWDA